MYQLFYASTANDGVDQRKIAELLEKARFKNSKNGITGILVYHGGIFIQLLEGEKEQVEKLYAKIQKDPRHKNITYLFGVEGNERLFGEWSMLYHKCRDVDVKFVNQILFWAKRMNRQEIDNELIFEMITKFKAFIPQEAC